MGSDNSSSMMVTVGLSFFVALGAGFMIGKGFTPPPMKTPPPAIVLKAELVQSFAPMLEAQAGGVLKTVKIELVPGKMRVSAEITGFGAATMTAVPFYSGGEIGIENLKVEKVAPNGLAGKLLSEDALASGAQLALNALKKRLAFYELGGSPLEAAVRDNLASVEVGEGELRLILKN